MQYLDKTGLARLWNNIKTKLSNKEDSSNKVTSIDSTSTDNQYPSAKAVYNLFNNETVLYDNSTGSNEAITLSYSFDNYKFIDIQFKVGATYKSVRIYNPNRKNIMLDMIDFASSKLFFYTKIVRCEGTTISNMRYKTYTIADSSTWTPYGASSNEIYITRIVGYN